MRAIKTSFDNKRVKNTRDEAGGLSTPSNKQGISTLTGLSFFTANRQSSSQMQTRTPGTGENKFHLSKGSVSNQRLSTTVSNSSTNIIGMGSTISNWNDPNVGREAVLLSSQQKRSALAKLKGMAHSESMQKLDFLGSTNKSAYIDIKQKRINDLNSIYSEGTNSADFNSQNVFMNKLVYHPTDFEQQSSLQNTISQFPLKDPAPLHEGLSGFVKTMYSNNSGTSNMSLKSSTRNWKNLSVSSQNLDNKDTESLEKSNQEKTRDLFITKIQNSLVTPKFLLFQNRPQLQQNGFSSAFQVEKNSKSGIILPRSQLSIIPSLKEIARNSTKRSTSINTDEEEVDISKSNRNTQDFFAGTQGEMLFLPQTQSALQQKAQKEEFRRLQTSSSFGFVLPEQEVWNHEYLFILINNLSQVKRKNNIKYSFLQIPEVEQFMGEKKLSEDFIQLKEELKTRLAIHSKEIYLFLDDGTPLRNHMDIVRSDDKESRPIFVGGCGGFCGIEKLYIPEDKKASLIKVINNLIETNIRKLRKRREPNRIQQFTQIKARNSSQSDLSDEIKQAEEFQTREQFLKKQNKEEVDRVVNILSHNPQARIKRFENTFDNPRIRQLQKIESQYDKQLYSFKKSLLEVEASSSLGDNPEIKHTKNLRQIADYVDEFLAKSFPSQEAPIQSAIDEYNSLYAQMKKPADTKKNFIKDNIERYGSPAMAMKQIQNVNRELFVKNIPKVLSKYKLSRHDLHSIYILYKALLSVSIQRINWREVYKGGIDFKTFEHGIDKISSQSEEIILRMCNHENFINWHQFIDILYAVSGKTLESKIDIFIKVADVDKSGSLSQEEISELCYICLDKIIPKDGDDDSMVQDLVEYFTRLLFTSLDVDPSDSIPLTKLKEAIVNGHPENDLLCFFCGVDTAK